MLVMMTHKVIISPITIEYLLTFLNAQRPLSILLAVLDHAVVGISIRHDDLAFALRTVISKFTLIDQVE